MEKDPKENGGNVTSSERKGQNASSNMEMLTINTKNTKYRYKRRTSIGHVVNLD